MQREEVLFDGEEVDFENRKEDWNIYELSDGSILKVKLVLLNVVRSRDKYDPLGKPIYGVTSQNIVRVLKVSEDLRQRV